MTTGTSGSPVISSPPLGNHSFKSWVGGNGKYESYLGRNRSKWNPYRYDQSIASVAGTWSFWCPRGHVQSYLPQSAPWWGTCGFAKTTAAQNNDRLSKLLAKIKGHSFNAAVSVSQSGQLATMVVDNLGKFGRAIMALKHGDFSTAAKQLGAAPKPSRLKPNDVGGRWLELQYGWLPTLSDTYEAAKAFESISSGPKKARFTAVEKHSGSTTFSSSTFSGDRTRANCDYGRKFSFEMYEELGFERQLGLLDPLSVVWENIPYSFVVDWFVPIGTYLSLLNQIPALKGRWMVTDYAEWLISETYWAPGAPLPFCPIHSGAQFTMLVSKPTIKYLERHVVRDGAAPSVSFPNVTVLGAVHGKRIANAIALAAARFAGLKPPGFYGSD